MPKIHETTLEKIEAEIAACQEIIANKKAEIQELETAAAIIRRVEGVKGRPFWGKKIRECVKILLNEKSPQHFRDLAKEAVARGYRSQKGGDLEIISKSFWSCLTLWDEFERVGPPGTFRLKKKGAR
jgi:hypothetical protein